MTPMELLVELCCKVLIHKTVCILSTVLTHQPLSRISHATCARIPVPSQKRSVPTRSRIITPEKAFSSMHRTSASTGSIVKRQTYAISSFYVASNARPALPATSTVRTLSGKDAQGLTGLPMSAMAAIRAKPDAQSPTNITTTRFLRTVNTVNC